uniref:Uncharacterized protein n=1 Tax=Opuntia streptacantha TaxID=393608 RepID=A0A7C9CHW1_OPUST
MKTTMGDSGGSNSSDLSRLAETTPASTFLELIVRRKAIRMYSGMEILFLSSSLSNAPPDNPKPISESIIDDRLTCLDELLEFLDILFIKSSESPPSKPLFVGESSATASSFLLESSFFGVESSSAFFVESALTDSIIDDKV